TFSYAAHAALVEVDTEMGDVRILDYAVCEDGGVLINPMIVDGQVIGGVAQGIGTALYEEMPFDANGQPLATTLADYLLPGASEVPMLRIDHMETPSPYTEFGQKGIGEGGAIGPPAAIANAVNDALRPLGVEINQLPITPHRVLAAVLAARAGAFSGKVGTGFPYENATNQKQRMKPAPFELARPTNLAEAAAALAQHPGAARLLA